MPTGDMAFKDNSRGRVLIVLQRLAKRGTVAKSGISRNAQWAIAYVIMLDNCLQL